MFGLLASKARLIAIVAGVVILAGMGLVIWVQNAQIVRAREAIGVYRTAAETSAASIKRLQVEAERGARLTAQYAAEIATLQERDRATRNAIVRAPVTSACAESPAVRALLDGIRGEK